MKSLIENQALYLTAFSMLPQQEEPVTGLYYEPNYSNSTPLP
jgi:hypothetical protein